MNEIIKRILNDKGYDDKSNFFLESLKKSDKKNLDICFSEAKKENVNLFDYSPIYDERNLPKLSVKSLPSGGGYKEIEKLDNTL